MVDASVMVSEDCAHLNKRIAELRGGPAKPGGACSNTPPAKYSEPPKPKARAVIPPREAIRASRAGWHYLTTEDRDQAEAPASIAAIGSFPVAETSGALSRELAVAEAEAARIVRETWERTGVAPEAQTTADVIKRVRDEAEIGRWRANPSGPKPRQNSDVNVCAAGVDTLWLTLYAEGGIRADVVERLQGLRELEGDDRPWVMSGANRWQVEAFGRKPCWRYVLTGPGSTVRVRAGAAPGQPVAMAEVRAAWLWRDGASAVVAELRALLERWSTGKVRAEVSRLDLAVDWQGWQPRGGEMAEGLFVTQARKIVVHRQSETTGRTSKRARGEKTMTHAVTSEHWCGRVFTGWSFGTGNVSARVYRKDIEIKKSRKPWMRGVWADAPGYRDGAPVWRLEYQLRGQGLRVWLMAWGRGAKIGRTWRELGSGLDTLWGRLAGRTRFGERPAGWLTMRRDNGDENRCRRPLHAAWEAIADVRWDGRRQVARAPTHRRRDPPGWVRDLRRETEERGRQAQAVEVRGELVITRGGELEAAPLVDVHAVAREMGRIRANVRQAADKPPIHGSGVRARPGVGESYRDFLFRVQQQNPAAYLEGAAAKADALAAQVVGTLTAYTAALDGAGNRPDACDDDEAAARVENALRVAVERTQSPLAERLATARDRLVHRQAWDTALARLAG